MPSKPKVPCRTHTCPNLTNNAFGYCDGCEKARQRHYNTEKRTGKRNYGRVWDRLRRIVLANTPLCVECLKLNKTTIATDVDHITPWRSGATADERRKLFNDSSNLQPLCKSCHSRKTCRETFGYSDKT